MGAVLNADKACHGGHYADRMVRYHFLTLNHFGDIDNPHRYISMSILDALVFGLSQSRPEFLNEDAAHIHVLVGGQINKIPDVVK